MTVSLILRDSEEDMLASDAQRLMCCRERDVNSLCMMMTFGGRLKICAARGW
jgi:hypothetical protein